MIEKKKRQENKMCMHKSKLYHEKLSEESPKTMAKTVKKKTAKENEANDLCIPFCHATSSYYINPSVHLWLKPLLGSQESRQCFSAVIWRFRSDLPSESTQWHVNRLSKVRQRWVISIEIEFHWNRMCPVNCVSGNWFWRIISYDRFRLSFERVSLTWCQSKLQGWVNIPTFYRLSGLDVTHTSNDKIVLRKFNITSKDH